MKRLFLFGLLTLMSLPLYAQNTESQRRELEMGEGMEIMMSIYRDANLFYVDTLQPLELVDNAMDAMLSKLDPYCEYISKDEMSDFELSTTGKYGGIGSLIRQRGEWVEISEPYENTPSARVGLKAGDRLLEIDGTSLHNLGSPKVSDMLKGDPSTTFTLKYRPISDTLSTKTVEITRERIALPAIPYSAVLADSIGYIRFNSFTLGGAKEVKSAYKELQKEATLKGLIIDLRGNGGGVVGEAIDILGMFVPSNTDVLHIRGKVSEMNSVYKTKVSPEDLDIPLAVLINSSSASASEIVAGALQDLDRAVIIGDRSFGKGLVQSPREMPYGGMLKITTAKYYTPSGRCIQALDYTHRREDGSVGTIPDSLMSEFKTAGGRSVYDGGGINPDVKVEVEYMSKFAAILLAYGFIDDFANLWAAQNSPAKEGFEVGDEIYSEFVAFMADKTIEYESLSAVKLRELRQSAEKEDYEDKILEELDAIAEKIKDDKDAELVRCKDELSDLLASSILTRLYFSKAAIEYSMPDDTVVQKAIEILSDSEQYDKILTEKNTTKN